MNIKLWLACALAGAGLFFWAGWYARQRLAETPAPTVAVDTTASQTHETVRTVTRTIVVKEPTKDGPRTTTTTEMTQDQAKVEQSTQRDSNPVPVQHADRSKYSVGVLVTPRVDETWRDSYKPTAVELGYRLGDSPLSAIGGYDWRRREFQLGVRMEF